MLFWRREGPALTPPPSTDGSAGNSELYSEIPPLASESVSNTSGGPLNPLPSFYDVIRPHTIEREEEGEEEEEGEGGGEGEKGGGEVGEMFDNKGNLVREEEEGGGGGDGNGAESNGEAGKNCEGSPSPGNHGVNLYESVLDTTTVSYQEDQEKPGYSTLERRRGYATLEPYTGSGTLRIIRRPREREKQRNNGEEEEEEEEEETEEEEYSHLQY